MENNVLKIAEEEMRKYLYQGPRFKSLGPNSGEEFRDDVLLPWLKRLGPDEKGTVDFAETKMYSPSFLEEAFGGAVRKGFGPQISKLKFEHIDGFYAKQITQYINEALKKQ
jgi:hypothetical protein